jgi:hypothetical protein
LGDPAFLPEHPSGISRQQQIIPPAQHDHTSDTGSLWRAPSGARCFLR